jgi:hypothetical protein
VSDRPEFVEGRVYRYEEIAPYAFPAKGSNGLRTPDMRFVYHRNPETGTGFFDELVEPENPLVSSEQAQRHVEAMREHGMSYREIARLAGVSIEAVHRSASGVGRIRSSTEEALLQTASSLTTAITDPSQRCGGLPGRSSSQGLAPRTVETLRETDEEEQVAGSYRQGQDVDCRASREHSAHRPWRLLRRQVVTPRLPTDMLHLQPGGIALSSKLPRC